MIDGGSSVAALNPMGRPTAKRGGAGRSARDGLFDHPRIRYGIEARSASRCHRYRTLVPLEPMHRARGDPAVEEALDLVIFYVRP